MSNSTNIPRYDRLSETSGGIPKNAEWYYGPQFRTLAAYQFDAFKLKTFLMMLLLTSIISFGKKAVTTEVIKTALNHRTEKYMLWVITLPLGIKMKSTN